MVLSDYGPEQSLIQLARHTIKTLRMAFLQSCTACKHTALSTRSGVGADGEHICEVAREACGR